MCGRKIFDSVCVFTLLPYKNLIALIWLPKLTRNLTKYFYFSYGNTRGVGGVWVWNLVADIAEGKEAECV